MLSSLVTSLVDALIAMRERQGLLSMVRSAVPDEMVASSVPSTNDWIGWRPIPSTVSDEELDRLEREIGYRYPPLYRDLLKYRHFVELSTPGLRLFRHPVGSWERELRFNYFEMNEPERIVGIGLIPFGDEAFMDAGPVCFDARAPLPDGDMPVVFWDHEWMGTEKEIQPLFSSMRTMCECLTIAAEYDGDIFAEDEYAEPADAELRRRLRERFFDADPDGAGGPARAYWMMNVADVDGEV